MLAKNVNDNARRQNQRGAFAFFASKLAPTESLTEHFHLAAVQLVHAAHYQQFSRRDRIGQQA